MQRVATDWRVLALCYAAGVLILSLRAALGGAPLLADPDDAMRLVGVRDLIAGQGWFDPMQYRLDPPHGVAMHWSRLADLPLATAVLLLTPLLGMATAELVAITLYPLALLLPMLWLAHRLALRLGGPEAGLAGAVLALFSLVAFTEFTPGRIDHHGLILILGLAMLAGLLAAAERPRMAALAGLATAAGLAIGVESLPAVVALLLAAGLWHILVPGQGRVLQALGLGLAGGALLFTAALIPPGRWSVGACDAWSAPYGLALLSGGAALWGLGLPALSQRPMVVRLALGLGAGAPAAGLVALLYPACLAGPYGGLDPYLVSHWLARVEEARSALAVLPGAPAQVLAPLVPALLAAGFAASRLWRGPLAARPLWAAYLVFLLLALAVGLLQVRGLKALGLFAVPGAAALIAAARAAYLARSDLPRAAVLVGSWLGATGMVVALLAGLATPRTTADPGAAAPVRTAACHDGAAYAALAALPAEPLLAPIDMGGHLLLHTPHSVVGAPYHRNQQGIVDTLRFFHAFEAEARALAARRGIATLVLCPGLPELRPLPDSAPDALVRQLAAGEAPTWLVPLEQNGPIARYAVRP